MGRGNRERVARAFVLAALVCLAAPGAARAVDDDGQTWLAVVATGGIGARPTPWRYHLEGQARYNDDSSRFHQGLLRGALGREVAARTVLWAGYAYVPTDPEGDPSDVLEHRFWQQLTWSADGEVAGFHPSIRTRLEERVVESADDTGVRVRQLGKLTRPIDAEGRFYWALWDEIFVNLNDTDWGADAGIDQNRAFGGIGIVLADGVNAEVGYLHQFIERSGRADSSNHTLSLTLLLNR
jgi:hypothetical protein